MVATRSKAAPPRPSRPPDFFTHPSEEELIVAFLRPRVSGDKSCAFIHDADVYSASPAQLTNEFPPAIAGNGDRAWYFFSTVRAKTRDGQRKARTVDTGEGCWHSEAGAKPVVEEPRRRLGHRQSFSFVTMADGRRVRSGWLMVELGLDDAEHVVLCKVYFSPRARPAGGGTAAAAASSLAARKRKAPAATADDKENPAPARRKRRASPTEAAGTEGEDDTQGGSGIVEEKPVADDPDPLLWQDDSVLSWLMRDRAVRHAQGYVDRPDEVILEENGLGDFMRLLDDLGKDRCEPPPPSSPSSTAGDRGYPACLKPAF